MQSHFHMEITESASLNTIMLFCPYIVKGARRGGGGGGGGQNAPLKEIFYHNLRDCPI